MLDRPNPIGGLAVEGPALRPGFGSFVGAHPIATRHGMTIGELATFYRAGLKLDVDLTVVPCEGWQRAIPGATMEIIPDAGHFPHWEQPEAFAERFSAFVDKNS